MARRIKFSDKKHTRQGMASAVLALVSLLLLVWGIYQAYQTSGNAGGVAGLLGLLSILASVVGFILAIRGFGEQDVYYMFSQVGLILNGVLFVLWVLIFIGGM